MEKKMETTTIVCWGNIGIIIVLIIALPSICLSMYLWSVVVTRLLQMRIVHHMGKGYVEATTP